LNSSLFSDLVSLVKDCEAILDKDPPLETQINALNMSNPPVSVENSVNNSNIMNNMSRGGVGNVSVNRV
jgi:hypothetical protein